MGKLSKCLFNSLICALANAQDEPTFQVTGCNSNVSLSESLPCGFNHSLLPIETLLREIYVIFRTAIQNYQSKLQRIILKIIWKIVILS